MALGFEGGAPLDAQEALQYTDTEYTRSSAQKTSKKTVPCRYQECEQIGRAFSCDHNLKQHIREKHTFEKPYRCEECRQEGKDTAFARPWGLTRHLVNVHGIERSHQTAEGTSLATDDTPDNVQPSSPSASSTPKPAIQAPLEHGATISSASAARIVSRPPIGNPPHTDLPTFDALDRRSNFDFCPTECFDCRVLFPNLEECLKHHHAFHGERLSAFCSCTECRIFQGIGAFRDVSHPLQGGDRDGC